MPVFLVALDLDRIGSNYTAIRKKLAGLDALQAQGSLWFAKFEGSADELTHFMQDSLGHNDRLFVGMINSDWAGLNMIASGRWLREQDLTAAS